MERHRAVYTDRVTALSPHQRLAAIAAAAMRERGLAPEFPPEAIAQAAALAAAPGGLGNLLGERRARGRPSFDLRIDP